MSKRTRSLKQQTEAYKLFAKGLSQAEIHKNLLSEFANVSVSIRTIGNWISEFKSLPDELINLDTIFEWHKCEEYGIPWSASHKLLGLCYTCYEDQNKTPSGREGLWWWRISQAAPELKNGQIIQIGNDYANREIRSILQNFQESFKDLNTFITYKPYNQHRVREYNRALAVEDIPHYVLRE